jgi:hypothetical protein
MQASVAQGEQDPRAATAPAPAINPTTPAAAPAPAAAATATTATDEKHIPPAETSAPYVFPSVATRELPPPPYDAPYDAPSAASAEPPLSGGCTGSEPGPGTASDGVADDRKKPLGVLELQADAKGREARAALSEQARRIEEVQANIRTDADAVIAAIHQRAKALCDDAAAFVASNTDALKNAAANADSLQERARAVDEALANLKRDRAAVAARGQLPSLEWYDRENSSTDAREALEVVIGQLAVPGGLVPQLHTSMHHDLQQGIQRAGRVRVTTFTGEESPGPVAEPQ